MISSSGAILAWKSDDDATAAADTDADADYDDDRKSDPYMSPSYAGDTIKCVLQRKIDVLHSFGAYCCMFCFTREIVILYLNG